MLRQHCSVHFPSAPQEEPGAITERKDDEVGLAIGDHSCGSLEVLSDHGDTVEENGVGAEEATGTMPLLPPAPWLKKTRTSKHTEMHCGRFSKNCLGRDFRDGEESSFFDC